MRKKIRYYSDFSDDFEKVRDFTLPENYKWVRKDIASRFFSALIYALAVVVSCVYCRLFLHMKINGGNKLASLKGGCYIYGNHTQPVGDVFIPVACAFPKRIYTVAGTANYGIPVIGRLLPYLGALPVLDTIHGIRELNRAMEYRLVKNHPIVIYPEAHVWEYYNKIRPFPVTSFKFAVKFNVPSFAMTVVYRKSGLFKRPVTEVFLDGPFLPEGKNAREMAQDLHDKIFMAMTERSKYGNCEYIEYKVI